MQPNLKPATLGRKSHPSVGPRRAGDVHSYYKPTPKNGLNAEFFNRSLSQERKS